MNQLLKLNQIVQLDNGENSTVKEFLGSGGQGEVYRIEIQGHSFALKWYFPAQATNEQRDSIKELIKDHKYILTSTMINNSPMLLEYLHKNQSPQPSPNINPESSKKSQTKSSQNEL